MDLSRDFIQYEIDNPHNVAFKSLVSYENREDTIEGFRKLLDGTGGGWILCKDNLPDDGVEVLFKANLMGGSMWDISIHIFTMMEKNGLSIII